MAYAYVLITEMTVISSSFVLVPFLVGPERNLFGFRHIYSVYLSESGWYVRVDKIAKPLWFLVLIALYVLTAGVGLFILPAAAIFTGVVFVFFLMFFNIASKHEKMSFDIDKLT